MRNNYVVKNGYFVTVSRQHPFHCKYAQSANVHHLRDADESAEHVLNISILHWGGERRSKHTNTINLNVS